METLDKDLRSIQEVRDLIKKGEGSTSEARYYDTSAN